MAVERNTDPSSQKKKISEAEVTPHSEGMLEGMNINLAWAT